MIAQEFIEQQIAAGYKVHQHKGVWWQRVAPFFCKPVLSLQEIAPGESCPARMKALLGYSHVVKGLNGIHTNKSWSLMVMNHEKLEKFALQSLPRTKQQRVRKGLGLMRVRVIADIEPVIEDIKDICIATAQRTKHGKPPEYYVRQYQTWRAWLTREFSLPKREWWGAYCDSLLIAYLYSVLVDETMFIYAAKSHTAYLDKSPNDALVFSFLEYCRDLKCCTSVIMGDWTKEAESLNKFKEKFGFEKLDFPMYAKYHPMLALLKRLS
jgi:hypothetical protein